MKKLLFLIAIITLGVGAYFAWKMWKGDGIMGWGGDKTDPWSSYTPPADDAGARTGPASRCQTPYATEGRCLWHRPTVVEPRALCRTRAAGTSPRTASGW